jgi:amidase
MDPLAFLDATSLCEKIRNREISSVELLELFIDRIERYDTEINSVAVTRLEWARQQARDADDALSRGENLGPLHGLPMTVKEAFNITGMPTTWGIPEYEGNIPQSDAVVCRRLQDAGAVIFGKTNVPIYLSDFQSYNEVYGTTNNPYDTGRTPGGSSGGSAAALAAGFTPLEMGSDIGGSIRNPSNYCGVYGLKPTWNIVPPRGHAMPGVLTPTDISVVGPMARSARDLELALGVVAGSDDLHNPGWKLELPQPRQRSLKDYRIAVWADDEMAPVAATVKDRVLKIAAQVEEAGGQVDYEARPDFDVRKSHQHYWNLLNATMSARRPQAFFDEYWDRRQQLADDDESPEAEQIRSVTLFYREWHQHNERRTHLRWAWHEFFKKHDLLLTPMCLTSAFPHDQSEDLTNRQVVVDGEVRPYWQQLFWAGLTGVSYLPSTVIPTGPDEDGLPIGVQIVGPEMGDLSTIGFAQFVSEESVGFAPPPSCAD